MPFYLNSIVDGVTLIWLELLAWNHAQATRCPWSWPWTWCPFKSFPSTLRFSNGSALCKMKMAFPSQRWSSSPGTLTIKTDCIFCLCLNRIPFWTSRSLSLVEQGSFLRSAPTWNTSHFPSISSWKILTPCQRLSVMPWDSGLSWSQQGTFSSHRGGFHKELRTSLISSLKFFNISSWTIIDVKLALWIKDINSFQAILVV